MVDGFKEEKHEHKHYNKIFQLKIPSKFSERILLSDREIIDSNNKL